MSDYPSPAFPEAGFVERRATQRRRVLKGATLSFNNGYSAFECVVRNQSTGGAHLSLAETFSLPPAFSIAIAGEAEPRHARICWRTMNAVGIAFV